MRRFLSWVFMLPAAVVVIVFAVVNRGVFSVDLWPLPISVEAPFSLFVLTGLAVGFVFGVFGAWMSGSRARAQVRAQARANARRATAAERDLEALRHRIERLPAPASSSAPENALPPPGAPASRPTSRDAA